MKFSLPNLFSGQLKLSLLLLTGLWLLPVGINAQQEDAQPPRPAPQTNNESSETPATSNETATQEADSQETPTEGAPVQDPVTEESTTADTEAVQEETVQEEASPSDRRPPRDDSTDAAGEDDTATPAEESAPAADASETTDATDNEASITPVPMDGSIIHSMPYDGLAPCSPFPINCYETSCAPCTIPSYSTCSPCQPQAAPCAGQNSPRLLGRLKLFNRCR